MALQLPTLWKLAFKVRPFQFVSPSNCHGEEAGKQAKKGHSRVCMIAKLQRLLTIFDLMECTTKK
jgi:hypothetical protein